MGDRLDEIYESYINGQNKQMVEQMNEYGIFDVLDDMNRRCEMQNAVAGIAIIYNKLTYQEV